MKSLKFDNGLSVIAAPIRGTKTATILVMAATGSKNEEKRISGVSHFIEHLLFKGTKKRPDPSIVSRELDALGAEYNAFTSKEYTGYWVKVDAKKIDRATEILGDLVANPLFDREELEREKKVIIEEINMYEDNPMMKIEDVFEELLYGDTAAGRDVAGTKKSVAGIGREAVVDYFRRQYSSDNLVLCLAGNLKTKNAVALARKYFSVLKKTRPARALPVKEKQSMPKVKVLFKKTDQAHLVLGFRTCGFSAKETVALKLLSAILGGSMSSRFFVELREKRGLAYYASCMNEFYLDSGYLAARAGVPIDRVGEAVKIILDEFRKIREKTIDKEEIARFKELLFGRTAIQLESSDEVAEWHGKRAALNLKNLRPADSLDAEDYLKLIKSLKKEDLKRTAGKFFTEDRLNLAVIGPFGSGDEEKFRDILK